MIPLKISLSFVMFGLVAVSSVDAQGDGTAPVAFADPDLAFYVGRALGIPQGIITQDDMLSLTALDAERDEHSDPALTDLGGLEFATNLQNLDIGDQNISDLTPLAGLTSLVTLTAYGNQMVDITPLRGLRNLESLNLRLNRIDDASALNNLSKLRCLKLGHNRIVTADALFDLAALETLDLANNPIFSVRASSHAGLRDLDLSDLSVSGFPSFPEFNFPKLEILKLSGNRLGNVSFFSLYQLSQLKELHLDRNEIDDLSSLTVFTGLTRLNLHRNRVRDLNPLENLSNLVSLQLDRNGLSNLAPLQNLARLGVLELAGNPIIELDPLRSFANLVFVDLSQTFVDLSEGSAAANVVDELESRGISVGKDGLRSLAAVDVHDPILRERLRAALGLSETEVLTTFHMAQLLSLELEEDRIASLSGIEHAVNLQSLDLNDNLVSDITPLANVRELRTLVLHDNFVEDIGPLRGHTWLASLDLSSNRISDLTPLQNLHRLRYLDLRDNAITDLSPIQWMWRLESLSISGNLVRTLVPLQGMTHLIELNAAGCDIDAIDSIEQSSYLTSLDFSHNRVTSLEVVQSLPNLMSLHIADNDITSFVPLESRQIEVVAHFNLVDVRPGSVDEQIIRDYADRNVPLRYEPQLHGVVESDIPLTITRDRQRVDISYLAEAGDSYRILRSSDLQRWYRDMDSIRLPDFSDREMFSDGIRDSPAHYYRVVRYSDSN